MSINFPKEEEALLERWREIKAFERQVRQSLVRLWFSTLAMADFLLYSSSSLKAALTTPSTMAPRSRRVFRITAIFWLPPSKTSYPAIGQ